MAVEPVDSAAWQAFFALSPEPGWVRAADPPHFTMLAINAAYERATGLPPDLVGSTIDKALTPDILPLIRQRYERCIALKEAAIYEEEITFPTGTRFWRTQIFPLVIGGRVRYVGGFAYDLTELRRANVEQAILERRLQETQKLESLGIMAGGIAHDFNNILTGVLGHVSLMQLELPGASALRQHVNQVEAAAMRAADLCRQMLAYSGRGRVSVRKVDLNELVRETIQLLKLSISKTTELELDLDAERALIAADRTQLQQVIMNLVINASEAYGDHSGLVRVSTREVPAAAADLREPVLAPELPAGNYLLLEVSDSGAGMTPEIQRKIFDPFFSTKFTGRGLGLSAVLGIVRGHGGAIQVESREGKGTTFKLLFPAVEGAVELVRSAEQKRGFKKLGTVLVVDDEEAARHVASRILETLGFTVVCAVDGAEGVTRFAEARGDIIAVLMDLTMPRLDGVAAFNEIRSLDERVPVILMSGYNEQDVVTRFAGRSLTGFLQKPFTVESLRDKLESALE